MAFLVDVFITGDAPIHDAEAMFLQIAGAVVVFVDFVIAALSAPKTTTRDQYDVVHPRDHLDEEHPAAGVVVVVVVQQKDALLEPLHARREATTPPASVA